MYTVKKVFGRSELFEKDVPSLEEAREHIQKQLLNDINMKIMASYRIYDGSDLEQELTQKDAVIPVSSSSGSDSSSSQGKGSRQVFSPTPLSTRPRPGGMPQNWKEVKDEDDEEKDK